MRVFVFHLPDINEFLAHVSVIRVSNNKIDGLSHNKIDGNGIIMEIDKAKFGRRKYCRRLITGQWLFGGVEHHTKKYVRYIPIPSRKAEVLLPLISTKHCFWINNL